MAVVVVISVDKFEVAETSWSDKVMTEAETEEAGAAVPAAIVAEPISIPY